MDILKNNTLKPVEFEKEVWDKKKLFVGVLFLGLAIFGGLYFKEKYLGAHSTLKSSGGTVQGASTQNTDGLRVESTPAPHPAFNLQQKVAQLKQEVGNLNVSEIASSSPQVQGILNQIKGIGDLPKNEAKAVCEKICSGI